MTGVSQLTCCVCVTGVSQLLCLCDRCVIADVCCVCVTGVSQHMCVVFV